jgi:hypothetical protein
MKLLDNLESMVKRVKDMQTSSSNNAEVKGNESPHTSQQGSIKR